MNAASELASALDPAVAARLAGARLWSGQERMVRAVLACDRLCVPAGNGVGKPYAVAWLVRWWLGRPGSLVVTTANTHNQVTNVTWAQIRELHVQFGWPGTCQKTRWEISPGQEAIGLATDNPEAFQGLHALVGSGGSSAAERTTNPQELRPWRAVSQ